MGQSLEVQVIFEEYLKINKSPFSKEILADLYNTVQNKTSGL